MRWCTVYNYKIIRQQWKCCESGRWVDLIMYEMKVKQSITAMSTVSSIPILLNLHTIHHKNRLVVILLEWFNNRIDRVAKQLCIATKDQ